MKFKIAILAALGLFLGNMGQADASLSKSYQFNGKGNWSLDGVGSNNTPVGNLDIIVPAGSTIEKAFLYSSATPDSALSSIGFDGTILNAASFTPLGINAALNLQAFRADVTSQVSSKIGNGGGTFTFTINSEDPNSSIDGEVLAVVYSNPNELNRTIAFLDGFSASDGDTTTVNFNPALDTSISGFEALFSLGIGFGFQGNAQASEVTVNGIRLTSAAGGQDDGAGQNGALITVGGTGDSPNNPANPNAGPNGDPRFDDELYNLAVGGFLNNGDTSLVINTLNPSRDDNIFFAGLNITAQANVNPTEIPESSSILSLLAFGTLGASLIAKKKRQ